MRILQPWDVYPKAFQAEKAKAELGEEAFALEKYKEARRAYAARWNRRFEEENNGEQT